MIFFIFIFVSNILFAESLYVGDSARIEASGIKKVTVSNGKILKVSKGMKNELLVTARSQGHASLNIWYKDGKFQNINYSVMSSEVFKRLQKVKEALSSVQGLKISSAADSIYIMGTVDSKSDMELVAKVAGTHAKIMNYVKASSEVQSGMNKRVAETLSELGVYDASVSNTDSIIVIDGKTRNKDAVDNATAYVKAVFPTARINIKIVPYQVDIDVKILEVTTSGMMRFGLEPPSEVTVTRHTVLSRVELDSILHMEENNGSARLLANPSLSANDNEPATFHAGGEIPIKVSARFMSKLSWKDYGIILKFTPKVITDEAVELNISSEFSNVDDSRKVDDIPGFLVRKVNTVVTVDSGKTVIISGLIEKNRSSNVKGLPLLARIPLLGSLFSFNSDDRKDTELAIIVSPDIRFRCEELVIDKKLEDLLIESMSEELKPDDTKQL